MPLWLVAGGVALVAVALLLAYGFGRLLRGRTPSSSSYVATGGGGSDGDDVQRLLRRHHDMAQAIESGLYRIRSQYGEPGLVAELRRLEGLAAQIRSDLGYTAQAVDDLSRRRPPEGP